MLSHHIISPQRQQGLRIVIALACAAGWCNAPLVAQPPKATPGNRLAYLDDFDPYYPHAKFPKLITPQWVGEDGVEAVVILAIDDMRDPKKYEAYLRPILRRLQQIDGRAPVSIMTCSVDPKDPQLRTWLKEGLSIECHTIDHPCPFFKPGFEKAKNTYDRCIDLMNDIPGNKPVAFRMPCCDSLNTPSPRFWSEIFNKSTERGKFLSIDSSVFTVYTSADPELPKSLTLDADGKERFTRYLPMDRSFVNWIENYPYPYVIGNLCWQFPCMTPSDWQAQHIQKPNNPKTVEDWKAALDCTVLKQGVMTMVFHPHGWIGNDQMVELIDYAVAKHGKKVKFLNFKEAQERINQNLMEGRSLRNSPWQGQHRIHLLDRDSDGRYDLIYLQMFPYKYGPSYEWLPKKGKWNRIGTLPNGLTEADRESRMHRIPIDEGLARKAPFAVPPGAKLVLEIPRDAGDVGLRFLDLNSDGKLDLIFSDEQEYGIYLFTDMENGWSKKVLAGKRGVKEPRTSVSGGTDPLPMISRNGQNNGFWVHSGQLWWSNEDTVLLKDHVDRRKIADLLHGAP